MSQLWLLRHGATEYSLTRRYLGWLDLPLAPEGWEQVSRLARPDWPASQWVSDRLRALQTAQAMGLTQIRITSALREFDFGHLEGLTWEQLSPQDQAQLAAWAPDFKPGSESLAQFDQRVQEFCQQLGPGHHLLICHGGVIMALQRWLKQEQRPPRAGQLLTVTLAPDRPATSCDSP